MENLSIIKSRTLALSECNSKKLNPIKSKQMLGSLLLFHIHEILIECFEKDKTNLKSPITTTLECYRMESNMFQYFIKEIIKSGEYTLDGIAYYTQIPADIIYETLCEKNINISITMWVRMLSLYLKVRPEISEFFWEKMNQMRQKGNVDLEALLKEIIR